MLAVLAIAAMFISLVVTFGAGFTLGYVKAPTRTKIVEKQKCKYCNTDLTGLPELDIINHHLCITRAPEEIAALKIEAGKKPNEIESSKAEYHFTIGRLVYDRLNQIPAAIRNNVQFCSDTYGTYYYETYPARIYRNGKLISTKHYKTERSARKYTAEEIETDKHIVKHQGVK